MSSPQPITCFGGSPADPPGPATAPPGHAGHTPSTEECGEGMTHPGQPQVLRVWPGQQRGRAVRTTSQLSDPAYVFSIALTNIYHRFDWFIAFVARSPHLSSECEFPRARIFVYFGQEQCLDHSRYSVNID